MVPLLLPQDCRPSGDVSQKGRQRESKVLRVYPVLRAVAQRRQPSALPGTVTRVVLGERSQPQARGSLLAVAKLSFWGVSSLLAHTSWAR